MPKRKQRKIHAPLKQDMQLYREIQKEKSPTRVNSHIPSTSSYLIQETVSTSNNLTELTTLSEETLEELGLTYIHKKSKEKTRHLEPVSKK